MPTTPSPRARSYTAAPPLPRQQYFPPRRRLARPKRKAAAGRDEDEAESCGGGVPLASEGRGLTPRTRPSRSVARQETLTQMVTPRASSRRREDSSERLRLKSERRPLKSERLPQTTDRLPEDRERTTPRRTRAERESRSSKRPKQETLTQMTPAAVEHSYDESRAGLTPLPPDTGGTQSKRRHMDSTTKESKKKDSTSKKESTTKKKNKKQRNTLTQMQFLELGLSPHKGEHNVPSDGLEYEDYEPLLSPAHPPTEPAGKTMFRPKAEDDTTPRKRAKLELDPEPPSHALSSRRRVAAVPSSQSPSVHSPSPTRSAARSSSQSPTANPVSTRSSARRPLLPWSENADISPEENARAVSVSPLMKRTQAPVRSASTTPMKSEATASSPQRTSPVSSREAPPPADKPRLKYQDANMTIPDSESETDSPVLLPVMLQQEEELVPIPRPSQATTVDEASSPPRSNFVQPAPQPLRAGRRRQSPHPPSSSLPRAPDSDVPSETGESHGSTRFLTDSQLLPESIMDFKLPKLPSWSQHSVE